MIAARALFFYAGKLLWPAELAVIYPHWDVDASDPVSWGFLVGCSGRAGGALGTEGGGSARAPLVGAAFFALTLSPVLGFVDYGYMQFSFVADRHQYLAGCGVLAVLASAGAHAAGRLKGAARMAAHAAGAAVLVLLMVKTWSQAGVYRNGGHLLPAHRRAQSKREGSSQQSCRRPALRGSFRGGRRVEPHCDRTAP